MHGNEQADSDHNNPVPRSRASMSASLLGPYSLALPVIPAEHRGRGKFSSDSGAVAGTCFSIGNGIFMTAGHVAAGIRESGKVGIVLAVSPQRDTPRALPVAEFEDLPCDIGLLRVPSAAKLPPDWIYTLRWRRTPIVQFDDVRTLGFPHGSHTLGKRTNVIQRAFRGYIVCDPPEFELPAFGGQRFGLYEVSFPAPLGLSGAPLLFGTGQFLPRIAVSGVIIGNSQYKMFVPGSGETISENGETTIVERYESLSLGIAVPVQDILPLRSELVASTIGEYLEAQDLLYS
jgi:hypothetical protein